MAGTVQKTACGGFNNIVSFTMHVAAGLDSMPCWQAVITLPARHCMAAALTVLCAYQMSLYVCVRELLTAH